MSTLGVEPCPSPQQKTNGCQETSGLACLAKTGMSLPTWSATAAPALRNLPSFRCFFVGEIKHSGCINQQLAVEWKVNLSRKSSRKKSELLEVPWNDLVGCFQTTAVLMTSYQIQQSSPSTEVETKSPKCVYSGWCPAVRSCLSLIHVIQEQDSHARNTESQLSWKKKCFSRSHK